MTRFNSIQDRDIGYLRSVEGRGNIDAMTDALRELGGDGSFVAAKTIDLIKKLDEINTLEEQAEILHAELADVWRAIENWKSNDYSIEEADDAVRAYVKKNKGSGGWKGWRRKKK